MINNKYLRQWRMIIYNGQLFTIYCLSFVFTVVSCTDSRTFRLRGDFSHLRQVDFFIYSTDGGLEDVDTLHIIDGKFDWQTPLEREATFYVIFPNLSEQVIFAAPGDVIKMKGDAQQLRAVNITGNKDNEVLTKFRTEHIGDTPDELSEAMKAFIQEQPQSSVSSYFQKQLTLQIAKASQLTKGKKLTGITCPPDGRGEQTDTCHIDSIHQPLLFLVWASWKRDSRDAFYIIRKVMRQTQLRPKHQQLYPISISLDTDPYAYRNTCRYDSVIWRTYCDFQSWDTPAIKRLNIRHVPYYVLTDEHHTITALGTSWEQDIYPTLKTQLNLK